MLLFMCELGTFSPGATTSADFSGEPCGGEQHTALHRIASQRLSYRRRKTFCYSPRLHCKATHTHTRHNAMNALRCLRAVAPAAFKQPSIAQQYALTPQCTPQEPYTNQPRARNMSLLNARRPMLSSTPSTLAAPGAPSTAAATTTTTSSETLDIMAKISASPAFAGVQIRCGPRDTYNPSHIVRKRRHGFLSRLRTKKGRKLLMRRLVKGRTNLSH